MTNKIVNNRGRRVIAALLLIVILSASLITATSCKKDFDYLKADLSEYVEITGDYKNFKVEIDIAKPHAIDVDVTILNMLYSDKESEPLYNGGTVTSPITITSGDTVNIWYRGYILDDEGNQVEVDGMSNFGNASASPLSIGSNSFVPGFELNLIGKNTGDYPKLVKITDGGLTENMIAYVSYTRTKGDDASTKETVTAKRVVLSEDIDAKFGAGFKDRLLGLNIGEKVIMSTTLGNDTYNYTNLTVSFATECEVNPMVIECYFPYDYSESTLRNETAYFEVYVDGVVVYDCPEFTDEYLKGKIEKGDLTITLDELNKYEGNSLTEKYRDFATKKMDEIYRDQYDELVEDAVWDYLEGIAKIKKYPESEVEKVYNDYVDDISAEFLSSGGQVSNSLTGSTTTYDTFAAYATAYLGLTSTSKMTWEEYLYSEAEIIVKERLVLYYLIKTENLLPTDEEFNATLAEIEQEFIDEMVAQYLYYAGKSKDDYTDEEYAEVIEECTEMVYNNFDTDYFKLRTYYNIFAKTAITWPEVSTFDDRRAYPQDK